MRDLFPGYYRPTPEDFEGFWSSGLFALDANVLLSLYRFSVPARNQLLEILTAAKTRLWVPHQAALEFERGRIGVMDEQRKLYDRVVAEIEKSKRTILGSVRRKSVMDHAELTKELDDSLKPVVDHVKQLQAEHPDPLEGDDWLGADAVRDALAELLDGHIGAPLEGRDVAKDGSRRYAARIPPGYSDEKKPDTEKYGDLILWYELLAYARDMKQAVVLVTGDQKEDWWLAHGGRTLGPRPELVKEMRHDAGVPFYMYGLEPFMTEASRRFEIETSAETLKEAKDVGDRIWTTWVSNPSVATSLKNIEIFPTIRAGTTWPTPYTIAIPARGDAFVMDDEVVLTFTAGNLPPRDWRVVCTVTAPSNDVTTSVAGSAQGDTLVVRFPKDFEPILELEQGSYSAEWSDQPLDDALEPATLAHASFDVPTP
jgi:hypothetical protein